MGQDTRTLRALVVDDEEEDRLRITEILKEEGFHVQEARNGREALDLMRRDEYEIIVLDILMPYVDGFEVMSHMKKRNPEVLARTVVASRLDLKDLSTFFPACRVVQKPVSMTELSGIARQVSQREARND
jgi:CheY-like chemotaxis protein